MSDPLQTPTAEILKIVSNPVRFEILKLLEKSDASPSQIRKQLASRGIEAKLNKISYTFQTLVDAELIELVDIQQSATSKMLQRIYRTTKRGWNKLDKAIERTITDR